MNKPSTSDIFHAIIEIAILIAGLFGINFGGQIMDKDKDTKTQRNPFLVRFKPDYRYTNKKTFEYKLATDTGGFISKDDSITDKEAFAINFASERVAYVQPGASRERKGARHIQVGYARRADDKRNRTESA